MNVELEKVVEETCNKVTIIDPLSVWHRFSNFKKFQNTMTYCIRAIEKDKPKNLTITAEEKIKATKAIFGSVQQESFQEDKQTQLLKLNPFLDLDGLLRTRGRLVKSKDLTFAQKHPILVDDKHHVRDNLLRNEQKDHVVIEHLRSMV